MGGSGQGEQIAANKVHGVRAALCLDEFTARLARRAQRCQRPFDGRPNRGTGVRNGNRRHVFDHGLRGREALEKDRTDKRH